MSPTFLHTHPIDLAPKLIMLGFALCSTFCCAMLQDLPQELLTNQNHCWKAKTLPSDVSRLLAKYCLQSPQGVSHPVVGHLKNRWPRTSHNIARGGSRYYIPQDAAFTHAGDSVLLHIGLDEPLIGIWDIGTGKQRHLLRGHTSFTHGVAFTSDDKKVLTTSQDGTARLWNLSTGSAQCEKVFPTRSVSLHASGNKAILDRGDGNSSSISLWDALTDTEIHLQDGQEFILRVFNQAGTRIATCDANNKIISIWDSATGTCVKRLHGHEGKITFKGNENILIIQEEAADCFGFWDFENNHYSSFDDRTQGTFRNISATNTSGTMMIRANFDASNDTPARIELINLATGARRTLELPESLLYSSSYTQVQFNAQENLALINLNSHLAVWDLETGESTLIDHPFLRARFKGETNDIIGLDLETNRLHPIVQILKYDDIKKFLKAITLEQACLLQGIYEIQRYREQLEKKSMVTQHDIPLTPDVTLFDCGAFKPHVKDIYDSLPDQIKSAVQHLVMPADISEALHTETLERFHELLKKKDLAYPLLLNLLIRQTIAAKGTGLTPQKIAACMNRITSSGNLAHFPKKSLPFFAAMAEKHAAYMPPNFKAFVEAAQKATHKTNQPIVQADDQTKQRLIAGLIIGGTVCLLIWWIKKQQQKDSKKDQEDPAPQETTDQDSDHTSIQAPAT